MEPTFSDGTFVDVMDYGGAKPQRGDIIVFRSPLAPRNFIKRVIGLPGDTVEIRPSTDEVIVNGTPLAESYARKPTECSTDRPCYFTIPAMESVESMNICGSPVCYFVLGDNRQNSSDSRMGWLVPAENIIGWTTSEPSSRTPFPTP
jgi:signal peptidase I